MSITTDVLKRLSDNNLLSKPQEPLGFVSTGSYALNYVISGDFYGGVPIGAITQIIGESSTAKTVFVTSTLREAQKRGFYAVLIDTENTFSESFAKMIGIDPDKLFLPDPNDIESMEGAFATIENYITTIRSVDEDTPIVIAYDSLAVSPIKKELDCDNYESDNMIGAVRAKTMGAALRKLNGTLRRQKVALIVVNQVRSKVGVLYGNPETAAAGGKSLEYYLSVNLKTTSPKGSGKILDDNKKPIGIKGTVKNIKNKVSIPFRECEFKLLYDSGLDLWEGVLPALVEEGFVTKSAAWYTVVGTETKFQAGKFTEFLEDKANLDMEPIRDALGFKFSSSSDKL